MKYEEKIQLAKENLLNVGEKAIELYLDDPDAAENTRVEFARLVDDLRKLCTDSQTPFGSQTTFELVIDSVQDILIDEFGDIANWQLFDFVDLRFWRL